MSRVYFDTGEWVKVTYMVKGKYWHEFPYGRVSNKNAQRGYTIIEVPDEKKGILYKAYPTRSLVRFIPSEEEVTDWSLARIKS